MPFMQIDNLIKKIRIMLDNISPSSYSALEELSKRQGNDPFKILIATILSHRTRDKNTSLASERLFSVYSNVQRLAEGDINNIERLIKPTGFYKVKARRVKEVSKMLLDSFGGRVPDNMDQLMTLPSVGRKTANCVLVYAFKKPAIPVDTHVHRISNRLGIVDTKKPEETEYSLMKNVDKKYWLSLNELMVRFGQTICLPRAPKCHLCTLRINCLFYQNKSRA